MNPGTVTIAANLVPYLRGGVKRELSAIFELLAFQVDTALDPATYYDALARFDDARALFDTVGVSDEPREGDLEVDLSRWPQLVLRALQSEYEIEVLRLQDAAADGYALPSRQIPALGGLVSDIREQVGAPPGRGGKDSTRQLVRRTRRSRGR